MKYNIQLFYKYQEIKSKKIKWNIDTIFFIIPSIEKEQKLISIIFNSFDENIHYSIICKKTDRFSKIESLLYDKYPEYKKLKKIYTRNGKEININKSLKDNNISNNDIIKIKIKNK